MLQQESAKKWSFDEELEVAYILQDLINSKREQRDLRVENSGRYCYWSLRLIAQVHQFTDLLKGGHLFEQKRKRIYSKLSLRRQRGPFASNHMFRAGEGLLHWGTEGSGETVQISTPAWSLPAPSLFTVGNTQALAFWVASTYSVTSTGRKVVEWRVWCTQQEEVWGSYLWLKKKKKKNPNLKAVFFSAYCNTILTKWSE